MGIAVAEVGKQSWAASDTVLLLFEAASYQLTTSAKYGTYT